MADLLPPQKQSKGMLKNMAQAMVQIREDTTATLLQLLTISSFWSRADLPITVQ